MTSSQSTRPSGQVLWKESLVVSRFYSWLRADEWNFCPLRYENLCSDKDQERQILFFGQKVK